MHINRNDVVRALKTTSQIGSMNQTYKIIMLQLYNCTYEILRQSFKRFSKKHQKSVKSIQ